MADRQTEFRVAFEGTGTSLQAFLSALKKDVRTTVADMQAAGDNLQLFAKVQADAKKAADAFFETKKRVDDFRKAVEAIEAQGGTVGKELAKQIREAEKAFASATKEFDKQKNTLKDLRAGMQASEKAATALAAEQRKVGEEMAKQATSAFLAQRAAEKLAESTKRLAQEQSALALSFQANKDALGFKSLRDVQPEIDKVKRAYEQLRDSGKLSFGEVSSAAAAMQTRVSQLKAEAVGVGSAFGQLRVGLLGVAAALAGVFAAASQSASNFRAFAQQMAAVDSIAGANAQQLARLSEGVRRLSRDMGVDAVDSAKALYEILSSGISTNNALTVLEQATKAAIAGITDVATAARVGVGVLNAYGLQVTDLGRVYDVLFKTVDSGVITFPELANNIGEVIPAARAAKVGIETLGSAFVLLTKNGINAAESATSIRGAILALSAPTPEASKRFSDLNITLGNFEEVLKQIGERKLSLQVIRELVPDVRAQRAVLILAQNFEALNDTIGKMSAAAGAAERAYGKLAATPQARVDRFNASVKDLSISFGEFVTNATGFVQTVTGLVNSFNKLDTGSRQAAIEFAAFAAGIVGAVVILRTLAPLINVFVGAVFQSIPALRGFTAATDAASVAMKGLALATAGFLAFEFGKWARDNSPAVAHFGDVLGTLFGSIAGSAEVAFDALTAAVTLNGQAFAEAQQKAQRYADQFKGEMNAVLSGTVERIRTLTAEQAKLRDELGKSIGVAQESTQAVGGAIARIAANVKSLLTGVEQQIQLFESRLTALVGKLTEAVAATQQVAQQAIGNVNARMQQELAALETLGLKEVQRAKESIEIQRSAAAERLAILNKFAADAIRAFEAEAAAKAEIQRRSGVSERQILTETNNARRALLQGVLEQYRAHFTALLGQEKQHLDNIKAIEEQRRGINEGVEDKIRNLRRQSLTAFEQYADKARQIDELLSASRQALLKGDNKLAEQFANKALALTDGIADRVEDAGREVVSAQQAQTLSINKLREAQVLLNTSLDQRKRAEVEGAEAARVGAEAAAARIRSLTSDVENLQKLAADGISVQILVDQASLVDALANLDKLTGERDRLVEVQVKVFLAETEKERLSQELSDGVTVNIKPRTELIEKALKDIEAAEPSVSANVQPALDELEKVRLAAEKVIVARLKVESNVDAMLVEKKKLAADFETVWTVKRRIVEERGSGGLVGDEPPPPPLPLKRGGLVQAFARGGPVFRRPSWTKVPGVGNEDTVPAALKEGSFVLRKKASKYYGDGLLRKFAVGGIAERILRGVGGRRPFGSTGAKAFSNNAGGLGRQSTGEVIERAYKVFNPLLDAARTLRKSRTGQNLDDYLYRVLDIITNTYSVEEASQLLEKIETEMQNLLATIKVAKKFGVPVVMGIFGGGGGPNPSDGPSELFRQLERNMRTGGTFKQGTSNPYAKGGTVGTDTVPAMLTPGEHVIQPRAVRKYGVEFMNKLNRMEFTRGLLGGMLAGPRIQRFATGGAVVGSDSRGSSSTGAPTSGAGGDQIVNVYASAADILTPENVRRLIFPVFDEMYRLRR